MSTDTNKSPRDIEHDIERTRSEINETVDAIQGRLSLDTLVDRTVGYLRDSSTRSKIAQAVKDNPLAAVLIGIGVGWLLFGLRSQQTADGRGRMGYVGAGSIDRPYRPTDELYRSVASVQRYRERAGTGDYARAAEGTAYRESTEAPPTSVPDPTAASAPLSGASVGSDMATANPASPNVGTTSLSGDVSTTEASTAPAFQGDESRSAPSVMTASTSGSAMETAKRPKTGTGGTEKRGRGRKPSD